VKRPDHRYIFTGQVVEKYLVVQIISVNVVQMDQVRADAPDHPDQFVRSRPGTQSLTIQQPGLQAVPQVICRTTDLQQIRPAGSGRAPVSDVAFPSGSQYQMPDLFRDLSGGAGIGSYIDLKYLPAHLQTLRTDYLTVL